MARQRANIVRRSSPSRRGEGDSGTRQRLLEAAGQVFAEKGYDRATGKEICERAGANAAAVNYHFGGMEGLYAAVLEAAPSRLFTVEALGAAVAGTVDAKAKLEVFLGLVVRALTGPTSTSWVPRVLARELLSPSPVFEVVREREMLPKSRLMRGIVSELMGLPDDHPAVARGCVCVLAPCVMLLVVDRRSLKLTFPNFGLAAEDSDAIVHHLVRYALAGLAAVASEVRGEA